MSIAPEAPRPRGRLRVFAVAALSVISCGHAPPAAVDDHGAAASTAACELRSLERSAARNPDVPSVVVYEYAYMMLPGTTFPMIAIWANGAVVFKRDGGDRLEANIGETQAVRIIADVVSRLRDAPPTSSVAPNSEDEPTVQIVARDGDAWRVAEVYGLWPQGPEVPTEITSDGYIVEHPEQTPTEPAGFLQAYQQLRALRPARAMEFRAVDIEILLSLWDRHAERAPVPWPSDIPRPPADLAPDPEEGTSSRRHTYHAFVVPATYAPALQKIFYQHFQIRGHRWIAEPIERFRGQATLDRMLRCRQPHWWNVR